MTIRESYEGCRDLNIVFQRMGMPSCKVFAEIRYSSKIFCNLTTGLNDFTQFIADNITDNEVKNFLLQNTDKFDLDWNIEHYPDNTVIRGASIKTACQLSSGKTVYISVSLEYSLE